MQATRKFAPWALALVAALAWAAPAPAQEDEGERIERLLQDAMNDLTSAGRLRERGLAGDEAARAQADAAYDGAVKKYDEVLRALDELPIPDEQRDPVKALCHYNTACARSLQGRKDDALAAFGRALEAGFDDFDHMAKDTDLDPIRDDPRYRNLLERAKARLEQARRAEAGSAIAKDALFPYDFDVTTLDGKRLKLSDLRGKVVIVDFWGTWCPPCRAEVPHFVALRKELAGKVEVVGMTWEQGQADEATRAKVLRFARENGVEYPLTLLSDRAELQKVPDLNAFPTTLFVDKQGRVRAKEVGYRDLDALRALVGALLAEPGPADAPKAGEDGTIGPF